MTMETRIGVMWPQIKDHQGSQVTTRSQVSGLEQILLQSFQKEPTVSELRFWTPGIQICDRKTFLLF